MVAFLRAQTGHAASSAGASAASADADVEDDDADDAADAKDAGAEDEDEDEAPRHVGRFRRQAGNRKRGGKDPDEMTGSWNPYAGKRSFFFGGGDLDSFFRSGFLFLIPFSTNEFRSIFFNNFFGAPNANLRERHYRSNPIRCSMIEFKKSIPFLFLCFRLSESGF